MTMKTKTIERYKLTSSPLYRIGRHIDLAGALLLTRKHLRCLIIKRIAYYNFRDVTIGGKKRSLAVPIRDMRQVHERLKDLLGRIELPDYLYSPRKHRTPIKNAAAHRDASSIVKLDVRQFYPSTTDEHVFQFFKYRLGMADDIAGRLTKLCTINGRVPFGSPLSPILCALVHDDVFSRVASKCDLNDYTMTLWVDDITISGHQVSNRIIREIQRLLSAKRLIHHKAMRATTRKGIVITGNFVSTKKVSPANKIHLKIRNKLAELKRANTAAQRLVVVRSLIGLTNYSLSVYDGGSQESVRARSRRAWLHNYRRELEATAGTVCAPNIEWSATPFDDSAPWDE